MPPRPARPHRVELGHEAPRRRPVGHLRRQVEPVRRHDERHRAASTARRRPRPPARASPAAGRPARANVASPTSAPVDVLRVDPAVDLRGRSTRPPSSRSTCTRTGAPCGTCTGTSAGRPDAGHDAGRQRAPPGRVPYVGQRSPHRLLGVRRRRRARRAPASTDSRVTSTCWPRQSQKSVATPCAVASSASSGDGRWRPVSARRRGCRSSSEESAAPRPGPTPSGGSALGRDEPARSPP